MGCALLLGLCRYDVDSCFTTFFLDDHWAMGLGVVMFFVGGLSLELLVDYFHGIWWSRFIFRFFLTIFVLRLTICLLALVISFWRCIVYISSY